MEIFYSPKFAKQYRKLSLEIQREADKREIKFRKDPFAESLKTHKLRGRLEGFYSFSISYKHRVIFDFHDKKTIIFHLIGDHDIYDI